LCGAQEFIESMPDNSVDGICIFFPDPWEKRKQKKNRLLNESFSSLMVKKLKSGGFIWFKSDHQDYFNQAQSYLLQAGLYKHQFDDQPSLLTGGPFKTAFEELFLSKNIPYKNILVYKE